MTARGEDILAFLDCVLAEQERSLTPLVGLGTCPDWGHCRPECTHQFGINDAEAKLRRCASERKLLELHGGRGHSCPAYDYDGDLDEHAQFYDHEACPVVLHLAEGYGWTARQTPPIEGDQVT
jgi:hypothetical protein